MSGFVTGFVTACDLFRKQSIEGLAGTWFTRRILCSSSDGAETILANSGMGGLAISRVVGLLRMRCNNPCYLVLL